MVDTCLHPYRALDLTDERGLLCGRILADLGCDVIKVEKPGGDKARNSMPFYNREPDRNGSLYWLSYNANKRSITLDIATADGRKTFRRLVQDADIVIESFDPGYLDSLNLGYQHLRRIHPSLVMISITPFGQKGPYAGYKSSDLVAMAMGGSMYVCGEPDRPPVRIGYSHAHLHAGAEGASAGLIALFAREQTGEGRHVDVSMQECIVWSTMVVPQNWDLTGANVMRAGAARRFTTGVVRRNIWPCSDGYVSFVLFGGMPGARTNRTLVQWMDSEGYANDFLINKDWESLDLSKINQEGMDEIAVPFGRFFMAHTKKDLYDGALKRHIQLYPISTAEDIANDAQLKDRDFWVKVKQPQLGEITMPGPFARFSATPVRLPSAAPCAGEHNRQIYVDELGMSSDEMEILAHTGVI